MSSNRWELDYVKYSKRLSIVSIVVIVLGIVAVLAFGMNFGVDFKAGTNVDINLGKTITKEKTKQVVKDAGLEAPASITIGGNSDRVTVRFDKVISTADVDKIMNGFKPEYGDKISREESTVDPGIAQEMIYKAIQAVGLACLGIAIYVSIRFEWRFALAAIIKLMHDAFIVISAFSIFRLEVNLPFIVAVLTVIGYSINDTIVIFDRIRENMRFTKLRTYQDLVGLINKSVAQTMTRSVNTVLTVLFAAVCLFIFGSQSIRLFSLAMIVGLISGAYSSIFIANTLWLTFKKNTLGKKAVPAKD